MPRRLVHHRVTIAAILALAAFAFGGCDEAPAAPGGSGGGSHPATLAGTSWSILSVAGQPAVPGANPAMTFEADAVRGSGGCNSFGGRYRYDPSTGALGFDELGMTAMACVEANRNAFEGRLMQVLLRVSAAAFDPDGRLVLRAPAGDVVLAKAVEG